MPGAEWLLHIGAHSRQQVVLLPCVDLLWLPYSSATLGRLWACTCMAACTLSVGWHYVSMTVDLSMLWFDDMDGDDVVN
jgi:hypothetical protein